MIAIDWEQAQTELDAASSDEDKEFWSQQVASFQHCERGREITNRLAKAKEDQPTIIWEDHTDLADSIDGEGVLFSLYRSWACAGESQK